MISTKPTNQHIAEALEELANRLAEQGANPHRVQAYHTAAQTVREATQPLAAMVEAAPENDGMEVLKTLPGIGDSIASRIVGRLTLKNSASSRSPGRRSPGFRFPAFTMARRRCTRRSDAPSLTIGSILILFPEVTPHPRDAHPQ